MTRAAELADAIARKVTPYLPLREKPVGHAVAQHEGYLHYVWNHERWKPEVVYHASLGPQPDRIWIHEDGHASLDWAGWWRAGGADTAFAEFLVWHGAAPSLMGHQQRHELWAEHFTAAFDPPTLYASYPELKGLVPFTSAEHSRQFFVTCDEEAWAMARMAPRVVAVPVDANGDSAPEGVMVTGVSGLRAGFAAQGVASRVGFAGNEPAIGTFVFATDTASQAWGKVHARGAKGGGTVYVSVSAFQ